MNFSDLNARLRQFADKRDWGQFHSPKNISMALIVEAAELLEHFQWLTEDDSYSGEHVNRDAVASEIADIQIYLTMLADKFGIDIERAVYEKIETNASKYPAGDTGIVPSK